MDTSKLTEKLLSGIWDYFSQNHNLHLLHTQQWDVLETLQRQPLQASPPPIIAEIKRQAFENIEDGERMEAANWGDQHGVLISNADALKIVEFCERVQVSEQLPDYGTGWRPPWDLIDEAYNYCAIDQSGEVLLCQEKPTPINNHWQTDDITVYQIKSPVENWCECLWERPKN